MIDHVSLGSRKFEEAVRFYSECFLPLGYRLEQRTSEEAAFGPLGRRIFFLYPVSPSESAVGARSHVAVSTDTRQKVMRFHELAMECGGSTVRAPGGRPDISPDYFGTVIHDLDGHTIEVVHWSM
jgi:catechol 2,3-dioxygenase-like lactoylglutathione lyase family enzyme